MKRVLATASVLLLAVAYSFAGATYTAVSRTELEGGPRSGSAQKSQMKFRGWASGPNAKVEFVESSDQQMPRGAYIVSKDGGNTLYMVNPAEKSYMKWDVAGTMAGMNQMMEQMRAMGMKMEYSEPKIEKLLDESGPSILGYPTRHYRFRTTYSMTMNMMGRQMPASTSTTEEDIWATPRPLDLGISAWMRARQFKTGNEQIDKLISAQRDLVKGFPLKAVTVTTSSAGGPRGGTSKTRAEWEITDLQVTSVPDSTFAIPAGYSEKKMEMPSTREMMGHQHERDED